MKQNLKNKFNDFIEDKTDFNTCLQSMERFAKNNYILIATDAYDYMSGHKSKTRIFGIIMFRIATILHTLRCASIALINKESVREYLFDFSSMAGNRSLYESALSVISAAIVAIGLTTLYQELTNTFYIYMFGYLYNTNRMLYPLNSKNRRKFNIKCNFIARYLIRTASYVMVSVFSGFHLILSTVYYLTLEEKLYSFMSLIVCNILWTVFMIQCFAILWIGFTIWFMFTQYLKYKYNEINRKIEFSLKHSNIKLLLYAIEEHNYVEILTKKANLFFRIITFIIYYIGTIGFQLMLFCTHHKESTLIGRIISGFGYFTCFWAVLLVNAMSTGVIRSAHKSYSKLFSIIKNKRIRMTFRQHWKLLSFMEKLSGRQIGFYCYDLFPMNSYEFYQYLYIAGSNYILIMNLFQ